MNKPKRKRRVMTDEQFATLQQQATAIVAEHERSQAMFADSVRRYLPWFQDNAVGWARLRATLSKEFGERLDYWLDNCNDPMLFGFVQAISEYRQQEAEDSDWLAAVAVLTATEAKIAKAIHESRFPIADVELGDCIDEDSLNVQKAVANHIRKIEKKWKDFPFTIVRTGKNPTRNSIKRKGTK